MSIGSEKNIEDVKIGDTVISESENGQKSVSTVTGLQQPISDNMCAIRYANGDKLDVTSNHPLYTTQGWKAINPKAAMDEIPNLSVHSLTVGDKQIKADGSHDTVTSIACVNEKVQTYNLKLDSGAHTYFADDFMVHNKTGGTGGRFSCDAYGTSSQGGIASIVTNSDNSVSVTFYLEYGNQSTFWHLIWGSDYAAVVSNAGDSTPGYDRCNGFASAGCVDTYNPPGTFTTPPLDPHVMYFFGFQAEDGNSWCGWASLLPHLNSCPVTPNPATMNVGDPPLTFTTDAYHSSQTSIPPLPIVTSVAFHGCGHRVCAQNDPPSISMSLDRAADRTFPLYFVITSNGSGYVSGVVPPGSSSAGYTYGPDYNPDQPPNLGGYVYWGVPSYPNYVQSVDYFEDPTYISTSAVAVGYELRLFDKNNVRLADSASFTVPAYSAAPSVSVSAANGSIIVTYANLTAPLGTDWIGIYPLGGGAYKDWAYLNSSGSCTKTAGDGKSSGTCQVSTASLPDGSYILKLYSNNPNTHTNLAANSASFTVPASSAPSVSASVANGSIDLSYTGIASPSTTDWVGIYPLGAADNYNAFTDWAYLNSSGSCTKTAGDGKSSGTCQFAISANNSPNSASTSPYQIAVSGLSSTNSSTTDLSSDVIAIGQSACTDTVPITIVSAAKVQARAQLIPKGTATCSQMYALASPTYIPVTFTSSQGTPATQVSDGTGTYVSWNVPASTTVTVGDSPPAGDVIKLACWQRDKTNPPTGSGVSAFLSNVETLTFDYGYTAGTGWFQAQGGDVYGATDVKSFVASGAPPASRYFVTNGSGGYPGVVTSGSSHDFDSSFLSQGDALSSSRKWLAKEAYAPTDYYQVMYHRFDSPKPTETGDITLTQAPAGSTTPYYYDGNVTVDTNPWTVPAGQSVVVFVSGDLTIKQPIHMTPGGFLAFIVNGNILIDPSVGVACSPACGNTPVLDGVYITSPNGTFDTGDSSVPGSERLVVKGIVVAGNFNMQRDLDSVGQNVTTAASLFQYDPELLLTMPDQMKDLPVTWQEVAP